MTSAQFLCFRLVHALFGGIMTAGVAAMLWVPAFYALGVMQWETVEYLLPVHGMLALFFGGLFSMMDFKLWVWTLFGQRPD